MKNLSFSQNFSKKKIAASLAQLIKGKWDKCSRPMFLCTWQHLRLLAAIFTLYIFWCTSASHKRVTTLSVVCSHLMEKGAKGLGIRQGTTSMHTWAACNGKGTCLIPNSLIISTVSLRGIIISISQIRKFSFQDTKLSKITQLVRGSIKFEILTMFGFKAHTLNYCQVVLILSR